MMLTAIPFSFFLPLLLPVSAGSPAGPSASQVSLVAPEAFLEGDPYEVELTLSVDTAEGERVGLELPTWMLTPAAFTVGDEPLAERGKESVVLAPGTELVLRMDLGPYLADVHGSFTLGVGAGEVALPARTVNVLSPAPEELSFMEMPVEDLSNYQVLLRTNRGDILVEFWPDVAPNHVRNFLDLSYTKFYDGLTFHRVAPGFMIQGGDPQGTGGGSGPRVVDAEFSDKKHVRGILSMARLGHDVNSATSQFFIMHAEYPSLDGGYSVFGKMVWGGAALDAIANAPGKPLPAGGFRPNEPQRIDRAIVIKKAAE